MAERNNTSIFIVFIINIEYFQPHLLIILFFCFVFLLGGGLTEEFASASFVKPYWDKIVAKMMCTSFC